MTRIATLLLLMIFCSGTVFAAVYQCRNKDGSLFLTNNRSKFPPGCVQVGEPIGAESAPSPPAATPPEAQRSAPQVNGRERLPSPPRSPAPPAPKQETMPEAPSSQSGTLEEDPLPSPGVAEPERPGEPPPEAEQEDE